MVGFIMLDIDNSMGIWKYPHINIGKPNDFPLGRLELTIPV